MQRMYNFDFLLDEVVNVDGNGIYTQVIESPDPSVKNDVLMLVAGGPGFPGTRAMRAEAVELHRQAKLNKSPIPHIVLFDPLGCGKSDKAKNLDEYNVENYARLNVRLLEEIQKRLKLNQMNVHLDGRSFGGIMVMKMAELFQSPNLKLKQIISVVGADGAGMKDYTMQFLDTHFSDHPQLQQMKAAQEKLFSGDFKDQADYINNFVLVMAQLYSEKATEMLNSNRGKLLKKLPVFMAVALNAANTAANFFGFENEELAMQADILDHCSLPVINQFTRNDFNGYKVSENLGPSHEGIPVTFFVSEKDHVVDPNQAILNQQKLNNSAVFVFKGPHMKSEEVKTVFAKTILGLVADGRLNEDILQSPAVKEFHCGSEYNRLLSTMLNTSTNEYTIGSTGNTALTLNIDLESREALQTLQKPEERTVSIQTPTARIEPVAVEERKSFTPSFT